MRNNIVAGNWKMNMAYEEGRILASNIIDMSMCEVTSSTQILLIPPFPHIETLIGLSKNIPNISVGAQDCSNKDKGAYTGEVSASILKSFGVTHVVIGHSERRQYFRESPKLLASKIFISIQSGLIPIYCCGESTEIRNAGKHFNLIKEQIEGGLFSLPSSDVLKTIIAYEPVWAIGTGISASVGQAQEMHAYIRDIIKRKFGEEVSSTISILYGGSLKPSNSKELFACDDIDGGLVGGASLIPRDFVDIAKSFM